MTRWTPKGKMRIDEDSRREQHAVRGNRFDERKKNIYIYIYIIEFQKFYSFHNYHILGI
jgi:hypothetical protein